MGMLSTYDKYKQICGPYLDGKDGQGNRFFSGFLSGWTAATLALPFDYVKTLLQKQTPDASGKVNLASAAYVWSLYAIDHCASTDAVLRNAGLRWQVCRREGCPLALDWLSHLCGPYLPPHHAYVGLHGQCERHPKGPWPLMY